MTRSTLRCSRIRYFCRRSPRRWAHSDRVLPVQARLSPANLLSPRGYSHNMDARSSYREASVRGASPVRLVICLYEQAIEDLRRAVIALEKGAIEIRTREINHALLVIAQLQGSLDMERGGEVAKNLARFYGVVRAGLTEAHLKQSARLLEQQISQLVLVYEAWLEVERATAKPNPPAPEPPSDSPAVSSPAASFADWNA